MVIRGHVWGHVGYNWIQRVCLVCLMGQISHNWILVSHLGYTVSYWVIWVMLVRTYHVMSYGLQLVILVTIGHVGLYYNCYFQLWEVIIQGSYSRLEIGFTYVIFHLSFPQIIYRTLFGLERKSWKKYIPSSFLGNLHK